MTRIKYFLQNFYWVGLAIMAAWLVFALFEWSAWSAGERWGTVIAYLLVGGLIGWQFEKSYQKALKGKAKTDKAKGGPQV